MVEPAWPLLRLPDDKPAARAAIKDHLKRRIPPSDPHAPEENLRGSGLLPERGRIAIYRPLPSEAPLRWLQSAEMAGRVAYVRARDDRSLECVAWDGSTPWEKDVTGLLAPSMDQAVVPDTEVCAVLVPGLAFQPDGRRLGRGMGCYDRTLPRLPHALRIAVTTEANLVASLPADAWDACVHVIVTEARVHRVRESDDRGHL